MVSEQKFRSDLFFRVNVFLCPRPPMRDGRGIFQLLVRHFAQQFSRRMKKVYRNDSVCGNGCPVPIPRPGNIRELQNVIERAVIISTGPALSSM